MFRINVEQVNAFHINTLAQQFSGHLSLIVSSNLNKTQRGCARAAGTNLWNYGDATSGPGLFTSSIIIGYIRGLFLLPTAGIYLVELLINAGRKTISTELKMPNSL